MGTYKITAPDGNSYNVTAPDGASEQEVLAYAQKNYKMAAKPKQPTNAETPAPSFGDKLIQGAANLFGGGLRGAGSIGSTILAADDLAGNLSPVNALRNIATNAIQGKPALNNVADVSGVMNRDAARREDITQGLEEFGIDRNAKAFKAGKLGTEIAGTLGTGGAIANTARTVLPAAVATKAAPILNAIQSGGMTTGASGLNAAANMGTRIAGGAVAGGASAGLVNPEDATTGAVIGGVLPPALKMFGSVGGALNRVISGAKQPEELAAAINQARGAGFVIPPTQANPTLANRVLEGISGKLTTAQNASAKNREVFNSLASKSLGLPAETKLTPELLQGIRKEAGDAYGAIANSGMVQPKQSYFKALDDIAKPYVTAMQGFPNAKPSPVLDLIESLKSPQFDASSAVAKIKELRSAADDAFRTGNTDIARASKSAASELESALESHLQDIGQPELLKSFKDARQLIAKTYSVEKALNPVSGNVEGLKLAAQLKKGKPLSGDLKTAAEFATRFKTASQAVEGMGSLPQTSPLDWAAGAGISAGTANPLGLLAVGARPVARSAILSPMVQNRLIQSNGLLSQINPELMQLGYQAAPVAIGSR